LNKVILSGRLTKDSELKFTPSTGSAVANFTMAVDTGFGDKKETSFLNVVVWGKAAEAVANYTQKGSKVLVQGRISTRSYDAKDGTKKYITEIIADNYGGVEFLDSKKSIDIPADLTPEEDSPF
jgi:single-strand DNA-binding protein